MTWLATLLARLGESTVSLPLVLVFAALVIAGLVYWRGRQRTFVRPERYATSSVPRGTEKSRREALSVAKLVLHDGLDRTTRKAAVRVAITAMHRERPAVALQWAAGRLQEATCTLDAVRRQVAGQPVPGVGSTVVAYVVFLGLCLLGDVSVVTGRITAHELNTTLLSATLTSLALAVTQYAVGKVLGAAYVDHLMRSTRKPVLPPLVVLAALGLALGVLSFGWQLAWIVLVIAPAFGAAALYVNTYDPDGRALRRAQVGYRTARTVAWMSLRLLVVLEGRYQASLTELYTRLGRVVALIDAELLAAGLEEKAPFVEITHELAQPLLPQPARLGRTEQLIQQAFVAATAAGLTRPAAPEQSIAPARPATPAQREAPTAPGKQGTRKKIVAMPDTTAAGAAATTSGGSTTSAHVNGARRPLQDGPR